MTMPKKLKVEIVSDHVCPWCYIGKRRLEKAISLHPELEISVNWQPFQLAPDMPREGRDRNAYYREKFGEKRAQEILNSLKDTGAEEGIEFGSKADARSPNTLSAHVLMQWAGQDESVDANELIEKLFYAHHVTCEDIGDHEVLGRLAGEVGMDVPDTTSRLAAGEDEAVVTELMQELLGLGVSGVPFFIVNGRYGISGAQPAEELAAAFVQIANETPEAEAG